MSGAKATGFVIKQPQGANWENLAQDSFEGFSSDEEKKSKPKTSTTPKPVDLPPTPGAPKLGSRRPLGKMG